MHISAPKKICNKKYFVGNPANSVLPLRSRRHSRAGTNFGAGSKNLKIKNYFDANQFLKRSYRKGWHLSKFQPIRPTSRPM
jgi:hypothetical protein